MNPRLLVVVDMQKDFIDGSLGSPEAVAIVKNVQKKVDEYLQMSENRIIFTRDTHFDDPDLCEYKYTVEGRHLPIKHCIMEEEGWEIQIDFPEDHTNVTVVDKECFGYLPYESLVLDVFGSQYSDKLDEGEIEVEVVGLCTDICVISNAIILKATFPNTEVYVDASCCAGSTPELHKKALDVMRSCHVNIIGEDNESE